VISPALGEEFFNSTLYAALFAAGAVIVIIFVRYRSLKISIPMVFIGLSEVVIILGISAANDAMIWLIALLINFLIVSVSWWKKFEIDIYAWIGAILIPLLGMASWTIDLPAIGGIIAAIGTGVDHQIIIADETLSRRGGDKRDYTVKEKIKRAFFIIFGAAATTIAAMVPLMSIGIGFVRGFAITTIVGVLVGVLVTRPAYARIVEAMNRE
jgi:preprotein translocase subunit SecD